MDVSYISIIGSSAVAIFSIGATVYSNYLNRSITRDKMLMDFAITDWKENNDNTGYGLPQYYLFYIRYNSFINKNRRKKEISSDDFEMFNRHMERTIKNSKNIKVYIDEVM